MSTATMNRFEQSVNDHADVAPVEFWSNTLEGWWQLADHHTQAGDVSQSEFYQDMLDSALWLLPQLILPAD